MSEPSIDENTEKAVLNDNPILNSYTKNILFNEVWSDETLDSKTRSLITLAVLSAIGIQSR